MRRSTTRAIGLAGICTFLAVAMPSAYALLNLAWPYQATVTMFLQLGSDSITLIDGATSWNSVAAAAVDRWNRQIGSIDFVSRVENRSRLDRDGINDVFWSDDVYGRAFGDNTLAITTTWGRGNERIEADVLFNRGKSFNSYRGPLRGNLYDFRRVALHEFGHVLGLTHPDEADQSVRAVMNSATSDLDDLQDDDILGGRFIYGDPPQATASLILPLRNETIDFRHQLETKYRDSLRTEPRPSFTDIDSTAEFTAQYIWYRVNRCDHASATSRVFAQVEGRGIQPVCDTPASLSAFPSGADSRSFRAQLDAEYRDVLKRVALAYFVDQDGEARWVSEYVRLRLTGMTHPQAAAGILNQIGSATTQSVPLWSLSGTVRDAQDNSTISAVVVSIVDGPNAGRSTTTDGSGGYGLSNLQQSGFTTRFSRSGYTEQTRGVTLTQNSTVGVSLTRVQPTLFAVSTTASQGWQSIQVFVNGFSIGTLKKYFEAGPPYSCVAVPDGRLVATVQPGKSLYTARSDYGTTWSGSVQIAEGGCYELQLTCSNRDCSR